MQRNYEVIIVGAGPAGSIAAYELVARGVKVLLLDKEKFPRYKACGGGLTHKILQTLPFDISTVIEKEINEISFSSNYGSRFQRKSDKCIMYCVMREDLDHFLLGKAIDKGAEFAGSERVIEIDDQKGSALVRTQHSEFKAEVIIGADGANSIVAKTAGLDKAIINGTTIEAEIGINKHTEELLSRVHIDWGTVPGGYAWIFPKKDHISLGVGGPHNVARYLKNYYQKILKEFSIDASDVYSVKAHNIPYRLKKGEFSSGNILIAGDAAGLTDALTGEGIYYAVKSGIIAANVTYDYLRRELPDLSQYDMRINKEIMSELIAVFPILNIFHAFPLRVHNFIRDNERAWNAFVRVLRGEKSYASFPEALGSYRFMWRTFYKLAGLLYLRNLRRFKRRSTKTILS